MVEDDIHDLGLYDYYDRKGHIDHPSKLHHWQLGVGIWYLSELLNLCNFFYPFGKHIERKARLQQEINKLKQLKLNYNQKKIQNKNQNPFRNIKNKML